MKEFIDLDDKELKQNLGGSNDLFQERVGIGMGAGTKSYINGGRVKDCDMIPPLCIVYGIGAGFRG